MVNTGRPSRGCFACRKRRVKCDEGKPHCQRCINLKRDCPGYMDNWNAVVRSQNDWAKTSVARRVDFKMKERELNDLQRRSSSSSEEDWALELVAPRLPPHFYIGPEVYAINRFYSDYVLTSGTLPFLVYLPEMFSNPRVDACLLEAVPAVALASSAKQLNRYDLMEKAQSRYGQTLKALARVLHDENRARDDAALVTVFLLGLYEFITVEHMPEKEWDSHGAGRIALLRLRGREQLDSPVGRGLFILIHHQMLINSFLSAKKPASDFLEWIEGEFPWDVVFALESVIFAASNICHELRTIGSGEVKVSNEELICLVKKGIRLNQKVQIWNTDLPNDWPDRARLMETFRAQDEYGDVLLGSTHPEDGSLYASITRAIMRAQYRTVQIHLMEAMSQVVPRITGCPELEDPNLLQRWNGTVSKLAEEICDDVPFILGETDGNGQPVYPTVTGAALRGYSLLWPLRVAIMAAGISDQKRIWISDKLKHIGQSLGIGRATSIASLVHTTIN